MEPGDKVSDVYHLVTIRVSNSTALMDVNAYTGAVTNVSPGRTSWRLIDEVAVPLWYMRPYGLGGGQSLFLWTAL